jgi:hypothetical protein
MTPVVPDAELLQELDAETRLAWSAYIERVRELTGEEYERIEPESWNALQTELGRLDGERKSLSHIGNTN